MIFGFLYFFFFVLSASFSSSDSNPVPSFALAIRISASWTCFAIVKASSLPNPKRRYLEEWPSSFLAETTSDIMLGNWRKGYFLLLEIDLPRSDSREFSFDILLFDPGEVILLSSLSVWKMISSSKFKCLFRAFLSSLVGPIIPLFIFMPPLLSGLCLVISISW